MGTTLGEGAAFLLLESEQQAETRGVEPLAEWVGYGLSADAFHDTAPEPSGRGMARALAAALQDAGIEPEAIDYLNAHGTGTAANDAAEWSAIKRIFGDHAEQLPVSSSKSFLGHTQGAAGARSRSYADGHGAPGSAAHPASHRASASLPRRSRRRPKTAAAGGPVCNLLECRVWRGKRRLGVRARQARQS